MTVLVFISYATADSETFQIPAIAEGLTECPEIEDCLYWQEDLYDDIYAYMDENVGKCEVFVMFCSPNALASVPVGKEWRAADALGKPIIPVFTSTDHIPPLLTSRLGIQIEPPNVKDNIKKLRKLILKKVPKEEHGIFLQFKLPKNKAEKIHTDKTVPFIMPLLNFCMQNNLSVKNILVMSEDGKRVKDDYFDEQVSTVISEYGTSFKVIVEKMQIIANFKVCMIGEEKAGKSALLKYCVETSYDEEYSPTVGIDYWVKPFHHLSEAKNFDITMLFWDLGGSFDQFDAKKMDFIKDLFHETDGIFMVGDLTNKESFDEIETYWLPNIRKHVDKDIPIVLLANKSDLKPAVTKKKIETLAKKLGFHAVFRTSAKSGKNVDEAFKSLISPMVKRALKVI